MSVRWKGKRATKMASLSNTKVGMQPAIEPLGPSDNLLDYLHWSEKFWFVVSLHLYTTFFNPVIGPQRSMLNF